MIGVRWIILSSLVIRAVFLLEEKSSSEEEASVIRELVGQVSPELNSISLREK